MCEIGYRVEGDIWVVCWREQELFDGGNCCLGLERIVIGGRFEVKTLLWFR